MCQISIKNKFTITQNKKSIRPSCYKVRPITYNSLTKQCTTNRSIVHLDFKDDSRIENTVRTLILTQNLKPNYFETLSCTMAVFAINGWLHQGRKSGFTSGGRKVYGRPPPCGSGQDVDGFPSHCGFWWFRLTPRKCLTFLNFYLWHL